MAYIEIEGKRSIAEVARITGKHYQHVYGWSVQHDWLERARAYDNYKLTIRDGQIANAIKSFQRTLLTAEAEDHNLMIKRWRQLMNQKTDMDVHELIAMMKLRESIDRLGRRIAELPTAYGERAAVTESDNDTPQLESLDWDNEANSLDDIDTSYALEAGEDDADTITETA